MNTASIYMFDEQKNSNAVFDRSGVEKSPKRWVSKVSLHYLSEKIKKRMEVGSHVVLQKQ